VTHPKKLALAATVAALAVAPAAAQAESLLYVKSGNVFASNTDGSGERQLSNDGHGAWPSGADNGTIAYQNETDGRIYVLAANGTVDHSMTTPGTYQFAQPQHDRISPDGTKIAYDLLLDGFNYRTYWTPTSSTNINTPNQTSGQEDYGTPSWFGGDNLLLSHVGQTVSDTQPEFTFYHAGDADNTEQNWFRQDPSSFTATGYDGAISRDGARIALLENDAAGSGSTTPQHVSLLLLTTNGPPPAAPTLRCEITLPAGASYYRSSPVFSPNGSSLAIGEPDGIHVLTFADFSNCGTFENRLAVPGASQPYWSAANVPGGTPGPNPGPTGTAKAAFTVTPKKPRAKQKARFHGKLSGATAVKFTWSFGDHKNGKGATVKHAYRKAGKYKVTLKIVTSAGNTVPVTKTVTVRR
jgi:hypothetical protein